jgi:uncharacterized membrane protein YgcG
MVRYARALLAGGAICLALGIVLFELETAPAANYRPVFFGKRETIPPPLNNVPFSLPNTPATPGGAYGLAGVNNQFQNNSNNGNNNGQFGGGQFGGGQFGGGQFGGGQFGGGQFGGGQFGGGQFGGGFGGQFGGGFGGGQFGGGGFGGKGFGFNGDIGQ